MNHLSPAMKNQSSKIRLVCFGLIAVQVLVSSVSTAQARSVLRNICRVKGQEENVLRGLGLVVGLNGTGEANDPQTMRALARAMEILGNPIPQFGMPGAATFEELKKSKNISLVWVTARVPATGARRGDKLDCEVSAINGKSLVGGRLAFAALQGPNTQDRRVYALAEGLIHIDDEEQPLVGTIAGGCQMEEDVFTPFVDAENYITLIIDKNHANFQTVSEIVSAIRQTHYQNDDSGVKAINASNIRVRVPEAYTQDQVEFISILLELQVYNPEPESRVVINQRTGAIVIDGDVQIGDVVISHRNIVVEASQPTTQFAMVDQQEAETAKLQSLVDALNALKVPNDDAIEIIKGIDRSGKLHARLIIDQ
jgi:flagellar P-ring protein FlgI